jgi:hypothetical protein
MNLEIQNFLSWASNCVPATISQCFEPRSLEGVTGFQLYQNEYHKNTKNTETPRN